MEDITPEETPPTEQAGALNLPSSSSTMSQCEPVPRPTSTPIPRPMSPLSQCASTGSVPTHPAILDDSAHSSSTMSRRDYILNHVRSHSSLYVPARTPAERKNRDDITPEETQPTEQGEIQNLPSIPSPQSQCDPPIPRPMSPLSQCASTGSVPTHPAIIDDNALASSTMSRRDHILHHVRSHSLLHVPTLRSIKSEFTRHKATIATICALSFFSYIGEMLRIFTEKAFGEACHYPGTVRWDKSGWTSCVSAPGTTDQTGGAVFIDFTANVFGCFLMGFFVSGDEWTGVPVDLPLAFLGRGNGFQGWHITHLAIRTGLCGSLTTFASWNTQMVMMLCGGTVLGSQPVSALFGYGIGLSSAIASFVCGRHTAVFFHRRNNKDLAKEADFFRDRVRTGMLINRDLPDFERRFLHDVEELQCVAMLPEHDSALFIYGNNSRDAVNKDVEAENGDGGSFDDSGGIHYLKKWKDTTNLHRYGLVYEGGLFQSELRQIENAILREDEEPREELLVIARDAGWDVDALRNWKKSDTSHKSRSQERRYADVSIDVELWVWLSLTLITGGFLLWGAISIDGLDPESLTSRITCLSCLLSPFGTLCRWRLSVLNGKIANQKWDWLPLGTLTANMLGSVISALMAALYVAYGDGYWAHLWLSSIKSGFAGCLSTVSTYIAETCGLMRALPQHSWGYFYSVGSLVVACVLGILSYVWAVV